MSLAELFRFLAELGERRERVVGLNRRNRELIERLNPRALRPLADDKYVAKQRLEEQGVPVPRTLALCRGLYEIPRVLAKLEVETGFVVKPVCGAAGRGVLVVRRAPDGQAWLSAGGEQLAREALTRHLAEIVFGAFSRRQEDKALVEELLEPHPFFRELSDQGLSDVRLIVHSGRAVLAMTRVPLGGSRGRANLHAGGLGLGVDLRSGTITGARRRGRSYARHPQTGLQLSGTRIPEWSQILDVGLRAARAFPLEYLGVDVVLEKSGRALVLEVNARAGLEIQNVCQHGLKAAIAENVSVELDSGVDGPACSPEAAETFRSDAPQRKPEVPWNE